MKRTWILLLLVLCLIAVLLRWMGIGLYSSSSAVSDLKAELETIYGCEYTGRAVENGTEDMEFVIDPKTWFMTNWNLRNALGLDYKYECQVIFTTHTGENMKTIRTVTYQAVDPMGSEKETARANLDMNSRIEVVREK